MPSPFPGMDPYLESPRLFPGFHSRVVFNLSVSLQERLPEPYYAEISERVWVEASHRYVEPDVDVLRKGSNGTGPGPSPTAATVATESIPVVVTVPHDERRETFVEIFMQDAEERLVTNLEVLSITNKTPGERGRRLYRKKQREVLQSKTNLVEIDLLRGGRHTTAVPIDLAREKVGAFDHHVCVHRFDNFEDFFVYPIFLEKPLPTITVPLLPDVAGVPIDLQDVINRSYDTGPYHRRLNYATATLRPPLRPDQAEWAMRLLKEKGILPNE